MKIRTEPLLGAAMFGVVIQIVYSAIYTVVTYNTFAAFMRNSVADPFATTSPSNAINLLGCFTLLVGGIGTGVLYAVLHNRAEPLTSGAAKGGAAAGAVAYAIGGFISGLLFILVVLPLMNEMMAEMAAMSGVATAEEMSQILGFGIVGGIIGAVCGSLFSAGIGAILGAIGGALGGALVKPSSPSAEVA